MKVLFYVAVAILAAHGLIHMMGFVAYWPLSTVAELPYKTALFGGRWEVGAMGMKVYALLWLLTTIAFVAATVGLVANRSWWPAFMIGTVIVSTLVILPDWAPAFRGAYVNGAILVVMAIAYFLRGGLVLR
ncbi:MAG TPA: hypothetical protein VNT75_25180 [Symbiobacteriaceae bacterium]|nr:hypothetical protein [Symbiobacteriaceae bacterium]